MAIQGNFYLSRLENGLITIAMAPALPIGGWSIRFDLLHRESSTTPIFSKYVSSGYNNVSGVQVTNSGQGLFAVRINTADTSGLDQGNYYYNITRTDSGYVSVLAQGYLILGTKNAP